MPTVIHNTITGAELHDPKGKSPTPLDIPDSNATSYQIREDGGSTDVLVVNTVDDTVTIGNSTRNFSLTSHIVRVPVLATDPAAPTNGCVIYSKDVGGVDQLFFRTDTGTVTQVGSGGGGGGLANAADISGGIEITADLLTFTDSGNSFSIQGNNSTLGSLGSIAIGGNAQATGAYAVGLGLDSGAFGTNDTCVGRQATSLGGGNTTCLGALSTGGAGGVAVGYLAAANSGSSIAIGRQATTSHQYSVTIGHGAVSTAANQVVIGGSTGSITDVYIGNNPTNAAPLAGVSIRATGSRGGIDTNGSGTNLNLIGGLGTGVGASGNVNLHMTPPNPSPGTSQQSSFVAMELDGQNTTFRQTTDATQVSGGFYTKTGRVSTSTSGGQAVLSYDMSNLFGGDARGIVHVTATGLNGTSDYLSVVYACDVEYVSGTVVVNTTTTVASFDSGTTGAWTVTVQGSGTELEVNVTTGSTDPADWHAQAVLVMDDHL